MSDFGINVDEKSDDINDESYAKPHTFKEKSTYDKSQIIVVMMTMSSLSQSA